MRTHLQNPGYITAFHTASAYPAMMSIWRTRRVSQVNCSSAVGPILGKVTGRLNMVKITNIKIYTFTFTFKVKLQISIYLRLRDYVFGGVGVFFLLSVVQSVCLLATLLTI